MSDGELYMRSRCCMAPWFFQVRTKKDEQKVNLVCAKCGKQGVGVRDLRHEDGSPWIILRSVEGCPVCEDAMYLHASFEEGNKQVLSMVCHADEKHVMSVGSIIDEKMTVGSWCALDVILGAYPSDIAPSCMGEIQQDNHGRRCGYCVCHYYYRSRFCCAICKSVLDCEVRCYLAWRFVLDFTILRAKGVEESEKNEGGD
jgi:hypothetical protein